jgi:hypothetical protein
MATQRKKQRQARELQRLEERFTKGTKPERIESTKRKKGYTTTSKSVPMTESDKKVLTSTITNLKKALGQAVA